MLLRSYTMVAALQLGAVSILRDARPPQNKYYACHTKPNNPTVISRIEASSGCPSTLIKRDICHSRNEISGTAGSNLFLKQSLC